MMKIYDGRDHFYQWDTNQKVTAEGLNVGDEIHFSNGRQPTALIVVAYEFNGDVVVDVPNILLQKSYQIIAYRYLVDDNQSSTIEECCFNVKQRAKPDDYVYTETEFKNYSDLEQSIATLNQRIATLEDDGTKPTAEIVDRILYVK